MSRPLRVGLEVAVALAAVAVVGVGDLLTDARVSLALFHVIPIALVAYRLGWKPAVPVVVAAICTCALVDANAGVHLTDGAFVFVWRSLDRLLVYVGATVLLARLRVLQQRWEVLARTDALTGLYNKAAFKELCATELRRCERQGLPLSVAVLDLDGFKAVNDRHGHAAGDQVLTLVGKVLSSLRSGEISARLGGDEFGVLLPGSDELAGRSAVERLVAALDAELTSHRWTVSCSVGLASCEGPFPPGEELLHRADAQMYVAKRASH